MLRKITLRFELQKKKFENFLKISGKKLSLAVLIKARENIK